MSERPPKPTVRDVARAAGVSIATVSRALRDRDEVRPEVRARVMEIARGLGYRANLVARSLKMGRTASIGLILPDVGTNPYYGTVIETVRRRSQELGYETFALFYNYDPVVFLHTVRHAEERQLDGLLVVAPAAYYGTYADSHSDGAAPALSLDDIADAGADPGEAFDARAGSLAAEHLLALGHRRIVFLCAFDDPVPGTRDDGCRKTLREAGIEPVLISAAETLEGGAAAARSAMAHQELPTAAICRNDLAAVGAIHAFREAGLRVPEDMSVVGFDNLELAAYCHPLLTTVDTRPAELAKAATEALVSRIKGLADGGEGSPPQPVLIVRQSSAPPNGAR